MGERYQIHIKVSYEKDKPEYIIIHAQWMWGCHIIRNLHRLMHTLANSIDMQYTKNSRKELRDYIHGILTVNRSLDGKFYPYRVHMEEQAYTTDQGDSNHGWCILFIDIKDTGLLTIKSRFYDVNGGPVTNAMLLADAKDEAGKDLPLFKEMLDSGYFNNTKEDLQKKYNDEIEQKLAEAI